MPIVSASKLTYHSPSAVPCRRTGDKPASAWASLVLGSALLAALKAAEPNIQLLLHNSEGDGERGYGLGERLFTLSLLVAGLGIWHGVWCGPPTETCQTPSCA